MKLGGSFVVLTLCVVSAAQQQQQRPVFRAGVELVQVDVVVRDKSGLPVRGLTGDDFVILDRGKPQQVVTFQAVERDASPAPSFGSHFPLTTKLDVASNKVAQSRRLVVIVLDDLHGYRGRDGIVKQIASSVVEKMGSDVLIALLMTSGNYNVEITDDRARIMAGIDRFKGARAVRRPMQASDDRRGADLQEFDANLRMYGTLEQAARLFNAADGRRKAFILISENLAKELKGVLQAETVQPDEVLGGEAYVSGNLEAINGPVRPSFHELAVVAAIQSMRKSNVVTYAIDPRGEIRGDSMLQECHPHFGWGSDPCTGDESSTGPPSMTSWVRLAQRGLEQIADATGGFAVVNTSDFDGAVTRVVDDLDNYYLLGFATDDTRTQGIRRLEVEVKNRRDVQLRYRRAYQIGANANVKPEAKSPVFALAAGALPRDNVPLRLTAAALPGVGKDARVHVAIEVSVPRQRLEESDRSLRDQIRYSVTVVDMKGAKVKEATGYGAQFVLRPSETKEPPPDVVAYQVGLILNLVAGRYQLRVAASSTKLAEGGSVYLPLDVPDFAKETFTVSSVVLGYASGARIPTTMGFTKATPGLASKWKTGMPPPGLPFTPTLDREFLTTDDVVLYFEVARKDRGPEVALRLMAVNYAGNAIPVFEEKLHAGSAGKVSVRLPLKELGPGAFRLRLYASDGVNESLSEVPILIK